MTPTNLSYYGNTKTNPVPFHQRPEHLKWCRRRTNSTVSNSHRGTWTVLAPCAHCTCTGANRELAKTTHNLWHPTRVRVTQLVENVTNWTDKAQRWQNLILILYLDSKLCIIYKGCLNSGAPRARCSAAQFGRKIKHQVNQLKAQKSSVTVLLSERAIFWPVLFLEHALRAP